MGKPRQKTNIRGSAKNKTEICQTFIYTIDGYIEPTVLFSSFTLHQQHASLEITHTDGH